MRMHGVAISGLLSSYKKARTQMARIILLGILSKVCVPSENCSLICGRRGCSQGLKKRKKLVEK